MANTRCKSNFRDIQTRIRNFNNEYRNRDKLKLIGWRPVPVVNVNQSTNWLQVSMDLISTGYLKFVENDWVKTPIAISNHHLLELNPEFVFLLNNVNSESDFLTKIIKQFNFPSEIINGGQEYRLYSKLKSPEESLRRGLWCHSMNMQDLVKYKVPSCLKETKCDAINQYNCCWSDGHIETGDKNSILVTSIGEKLCFICMPGVHSVSFEKRMRTFDDFSKFISKNLFMVLKVQ